MWNVDSGELVHSWRGHDNFIQSASFSPDGTKIITSSTDGTAKVWLLPPAEDPLSWRAFKTMLEVYLYNLDDEEPTYQGFMAQDHIAQSSEAVAKVLEHFMGHPYLRALLPRR